VQETLGLLVVRHQEAEVLRVHRQREREVERVGHRHADHVVDVVRHLGEVWLREIEVDGSHSELLQTRARLRVAEARRAPNLVRRDESADHRSSDESTRTDDEYPSRTLIRHRVLQLAPADFRGTEVA
jgi:hypothetical protein